LDVHRVFSLKQLVHIPSEDGSVDASREKDLFFGDISQTLLSRGHMQLPNNLVVLALNVKKNDCAIGE